jgi:EAL domain-containing protein (putative c-di-GMP-specific phosphodiesterase class I)
LEQPGTHAERDVALMSQVLDEGRIASTYQPIVDLGRGVVVGFEAFVRAADGGVSAGELFRAAERVGRSDELEAAALRSGLGARDRLVLDGFLSLNVSAAALSDPGVSAVLAEQPSLDGIVLELTDTDASSIVAASAVIAGHRERGAAIAVAHHTFSLDDMRAVFEIQPAYVKLDNAWIDGIAQDNAKLALVETVCYLAVRMGVRVVAQGIEALADLAAVQRLGVGFGQGFLLARPSATGVHNAPRHLTGSESKHGRRLTTVARLAEPADELTLGVPGMPSGPQGYEVIVGELREPLALMRRSNTRIQNVPLSLLAVDTPVVAAARIALSRPSSTRFDPMVCVDELGAFAGVVPMERIVTALADAAGLERRHHGRHAR